jgi:acyl-homoserine lactone acylase PvdQ
MNKLPWRDPIFVVVELSPTPKALSGFPLGASEDPKNPHFSDITEVYARKEYKPVWYTWEELSQHIESDTTLDAPRNLEE